MRRGLKVKLSYSGDIPETVIFDLHDSALTRNFQVARAVHQQAGRGVSSTAERGWSGRQQGLDRRIS